MEANDDPAAFPLLDRPDPERDWFYATCVSLVLTLGCAPLGWMLCDRRAYLLSAAGADFERIDQASDFLLFGMFGSVLGGIAFLFCLAGWRSKVARRRDLWQPPGGNPWGLDS